MINFNIKYYTELYNKINPLRILEGNIKRPLYVKWGYDNKDYEFIRNNDDDLIIDIFVSQEFILVCYSKESKNHTSPNNLIMYNLKKEIIRVIPPPKPINWDKTSPIYSIGDVKVIDGEKHIAVYIDTDNYFSKEKGVIGFVEIRWLNLETFDYHPTENTLIKDYGR